LESFARTARGASSIRTSECRKSPGSELKKFQNETGRKPFIPTKGNKQRESGRPE
jgi:hypothetical protein